MTGAHRHENPYAGQGAVLLDIGGDVGALVVEMPASMIDVEVEVRPVEEEPDASRPHVAVVSRPTEGGALPSLVYPDLREGRYALSVRPSGPVELTVSVDGGRVTSAHWPD